MVYLYYEKKKGLYSDIKGKNTRLIKPIKITLLINRLSTVLSRRIEREGFI